MVYVTGTHRVLCRAGKLFYSHILNWEMSRKSFWKVFVPDKEAYEIMLHIAADRFREVCMDDQIRGVMHPREGESEPKKLETTS